MIRALSEKEIQAMTARRVEVGAVGRNAHVCQCGHIDYTPNSEAFVGCIFNVSRCIECKDPSQADSN